MFSAFKLFGYVRMATGNAEMKYRDTDKEIVEYSIFAVCLLILMLFIALTLVNDNWFGA